MRASIIVPGLNSWKGPVGPSGVITSEVFCPTSTSYMSLSAWPAERFEEPRRTPAPQRRIMAAGTSPLTEGLVRKATFRPCWARINRCPPQKICIWCQ